MQRSRRVQSFRVLALVLAALLLMPPFAVLAAPGWQQLHMGTLITDVAYGNGIYLAVGDSGAVHVSTDGQHWQRRPIESGPNPGRRVAYGAGLFVTAGSDGVASSVDGRVWKPILTKRLHLVTYENGLFVAAGADGLYTSPDGAAWTARVTGTGMGFMAVAYGNGRYVAVGVMDKTYVSLDGLTWEEHPLGRRVYYYELAYGNGRFVVGAGNAVAVSTDGKEWTDVSVPFLPDGMVYGSGAFLTMGLNNGFSVMRSEDGVTWTGLGRPSDPKVRLRRYADGRFIGHVGGGMVRSADGVAWEPWLGWTEGNLTGVTHGNGRWVAVGERGLILTSPDGMNWTRRASHVVNDLTSVTYGGGRFVATGMGLQGNCGGGGEPCQTVILTSIDGLNWQVRSTGAHLFTGAAYGNGRWVAVGGIQVFLSDDGTEWRQSATLRTSLTAVAFGGGRFVAAGTLQRSDAETVSSLFTSTDGETWTALPVANFHGWLHTVTWADGRFVVGGDAGLVMTSPDGLTWTRQPTATGSNLYEMTYGDGQYVGLTFGSISPSKTVTSSNAVAWSEEYGPSLGAVGYHRGRFLAVGSQGGIYERWTTPQPPSTCGRAFPDVPAPHPACQAIEALAAKGAVGGYQDGTFQPERVVTRAEFAKMLIRALGRQPLPEQQVAFSDVAGHWSATQGYLQAAVATGAINGFPNGTFEPDRPLTRAELVKAAAVLAGLRPEGEAPYVDVSASDWYDGWAASAARRGLIGPGAAVPVWDEEYFHGGLPSTRSEASAVLFNLIGQM